MTLYKAKIKENIPESYNDIDDIKEYAGRIVYITDGHKHGDGYGTYRGKLPGCNNGYEFYWKRSCFSSMEKLT